MLMLPLIPKHTIYTEAFFGGSAVFWAKEPAKVEFINDRNAEVINFYRVLKQDFSKLKREIDATLHIEGNNCRLRHCIRRAFRKTCCFSKKLFNHLKAFEVAFFYINFGFV